MDLCSEKPTYAQIVKASGLIGGAQAVNLFIGLVRAKAAAVLLGPSGVGLLGVFQSLVNMVGSLTGFGLGASAAREVACARSGSARELGEAIWSVTRFALFTGALGWTVMALFARPLARASVGEDASPVWVAVLGSSVLFLNLAIGWTAAVQGQHRVSDVARIQVISSVLSTSLAVGCFAAFGEGGIVPALVLGVLANWCVAWCFARRVGPHPVRPNRSAVRRIWLQLVRLGLAFLIASGVSAIVAWWIRQFAAGEFGMSAAGFYQAAWGITGACTAFILRSVSIDFYPRLTAVHTDNRQVTRLVNEQIETGLLLGICPITVAIVFAPFVLTVLYSPQFLEATGLLKWFLVGVIGQLMTWPMGYAVLGKGRAGVFAAAEAAAGAIHVLAVYVFARRFGTIGLGMGFCFYHLVYAVGMGLVLRIMCGFRPAPNCLRTAGTSMVFAAAAWAIESRLDGWVRVLVGMLLVCFCGVWVVSTLIERVGGLQKVVTWLERVPGVSAILRRNRTD